MDHTAVTDSRWHDHKLFLEQFRKSPRTVGAIAPSSRRLARAMLDALDLGSGVRSDGVGVRLVELGPGTGAITGEIARRLPDDGRCLAIDLDAGFAARVSARWPRIECVCDRAEHLVALASARGLLPVDHIVSGLPFASLPAAATRAIVAAIDATLRPGGTFTTFQYVHAYGFPPALALRRMVTRRLGTEPVRSFVLGNVPPALVLRWRKAE